MKKNGFTLIELLSVVAILAIIMLLATPAYHLIMKRINQNMYENKIKYILSAAESWASETTNEVVNVGHLIESGKLEADNEAGDFVNPVTNESMLCDVVRIDQDNFQYIAKMTEEKNCSYDDLLAQHSLIIFKKYKENGQELRKDEWYNGNVTLKVLFKDPALSKNATRLQIKGNGQVLDYTLKGDFDQKNTLIVSVNQILNTQYEASVYVLENNISKEYKARTEVKIDKQRPNVYMDEINIGNENEWTSNNKKITFTMSDGSGSGIYGYSLTTSNRCGIVGPTKTSKQKVSISKPNGTYYICVRDNAGNWSEDISTKKVTVSKIDTTPPKIDPNSGFVIESTTPNYNHYKTKLKILATDESTMSMYLSNTGFEQNGVWERYTETKEWDVSNTLDGKLHYVYLTIRDEAGNKVNVKSKGYTVYLECSKTNKGFVGGWGACNAQCGGGLQYRPYEVKDIYTNKVCASGSDQQVCNTNPCDSPNDYDWSKEIACNVDKLQEVIDNKKFASYIEYQEFRNALYDCGEVSSSIISSDAAMDMMRKSSRYQFITTSGKSKSASCKETESSSCSPSKYKAPDRYADDYVKNAYNGKVFVLSISSNASFPSGFSPTPNDDSDCEDEYAICFWENKGGTKDRENYFFVYLASPGNGHIVPVTRIWEKRKDGYGMPVGAFFPSVGAVTVRESTENVYKKNGDWRYTTYKSYYTTGTVYMQIFRI
ncbi:MAG: prepilin-type N-terminal cleavage/methylation domain-containing protein [Bacilli bacterium]|nr:prepilin-type N-terminal cleavage/methylation domain-containing protein [Bacilli bacterium]